MIFCTTNRWCDIFGIDRGDSVTARRCPIKACICAKPGAGLNVISTAVFLCLINISIATAELGNVHGTGLNNDRELSAFVLTELLMCFFHLVNKENGHCELAI